MLLAAACSPVQEQADDGAIAIECAIGPGAEFGPDCLVEVEGNLLVVRHPDGSFRRLVRTANGVEAADGAQGISSGVSGTGMELSIDGDRYRWDASAFDGR